MAGRGRGRKGREKGRGGRKGRKKRRKEQTTDPLAVLSRLLARRPGTPCRRM